MGTTPNRAYPASFHSSQILFRRTSDTLETLFSKSQVKNRKSTKKPNRSVRRNRRICLFFKGRNLASLEGVHPPSFATLTAGDEATRTWRDLLGASAIDHPAPVNLEQVFMRLFSGHLHFLQMRSR